MPPRTAEKPVFKLSLRREKTTEPIFPMGASGAVLRPQRTEAWGRSTDSRHPLTFVDDGERV